ncbi:MAG: hypothetical protein ABI852_15910 [Gemmatimonadaceae bacterium]
MRQIQRSITILGLFVTAFPAVSHAQSPAPVDGRAVLQRMHDAYVGKWYKTLTFTQKTTLHRGNGAATTQTWLESMRYTPEMGTQLRIDMGDLGSGQGVLYTADSSWRVLAGKSRPPRAEGNEFIPLIQSVYVQPVAQTEAELTRLGFNLTRGYLTIVEGKPAWVVGASSAADSTTSTFAIDTARKVLLHVTIVRSGQTPISVSVGGYVRAGNGWLATRIDMFSRGAPVQTEEYSNWKVDVELPASLFDVTQWSTTPHWARKP